MYNSFKKLTNFCETTFVFFKTIKIDWTKNLGITSKEWNTSNNFWLITGVTLVVLFCLPASYLFPQRMSAERKRFAYACTYQGLSVEVDRVAYHNTYSSQKLIDREKDGVENIGWQFVHLSSTCILFSVHI